MGFAHRLAHAPAVQRQAQGQRIDAQAQHIADGGAVVYWRPGCGFCAALDRSLGETGDRALWVNIWEDDAAKGYVEDINDGNATVPTFVTTQAGFVVATPEERALAATALEQATPAA